MPDNGDVINTKEAARIMGISGSQVAERRDKGDINLAYKVGRRPYYYRAEIEAFAKSWPEERKRRKRIGRAWNKGLTMSDIENRYDKPLCSSDKPCLACLTKLRAACDWRSRTVTYPACQWVWINAKSRHIPPPPMDAVGVYNETD